MRMVCQQRCLCGDIDTSLNLSFELHQQLSTMINQSSPCRSTDLAPEQNPSIKSLFPLKEMTFQTQEEFTFPVKGRQKLGDKSTF